MANRAGDIDRRALGRLTRHPVCNPARLASVSGVPQRTLAHAAAAESSLPVADLRLVVGAMVRLGQEADALELVRGILDLDALGWDLRHAPRPAPEASLAAAGLHAAGAAGEAVAGIAEAAADGKIDAAEAAVLEPLLARAMHRLGQFAAWVRGAPRGQASLPGIAP